MSELDVLLVLTKLAGNARASALINEELSAAGFEGLTVAEVASWYEDALSPYTDPNGPKGPSSFA